MDAGSAMNAFFPHSAQTRDVMIRVAVSYLPEQSDPARGQWFWAYHIRIENMGAMPVQLMTRHWMITDGRGGRHEVQGEGVVGEQPVIESGQCYDYVSGCPLHTPTGAMEGSYHMVCGDGSSFDATIPRFALIAPVISR